MSYIKVLFFLLSIVLLSGCGLLGGDDEGTDLLTAENFVAEPTVNVVQQVPADDTASQASGDAMSETVDEATAPLPTAITIPPTAVPPEPTPDRSQPTTYVVGSGDVLGLIAERFDVDIAELRRVNDLSGNLIRVGQVLTIPAIESAAPAESASGDTASGTEGNTPAPVAQPTPTPVSCGSNAVGHCVQSGDTLSGIASRYSTTIDALRAANPGVTGDSIRIGDLLTIPGQSAAPPAADPAPGVGTDPNAPTAVPAPRSDAECAARNPEFPFFHAADGLCYANPIGGPTAVPTAQGADPAAECPEGTFLWDDGLCYPIPGTTPTPQATPTPSQNQDDFFGLIADGCDAWEIEWPSKGDGECWPSAEATEEEVEAGRATRT